VIVPHGADHAEPLERRRVRRPTIPARGGWQDDAMLKPEIDTVLFDADGVFQRPSIDWRNTLAGFVGPAGTRSDETGHGTSNRTGEGTSNGIGEGTSNHIHGETSDGTCAADDGKTADGNPEDGNPEDDAARAAATRTSPGSSRTDDFIGELMAAEAPALLGKAALADAVAEVLRRWGSGTAVEEVLQVWSFFEADPGAVAVVQELRAAGISCHLATNQNDYRRRIMQDERRYGDWFDRSFYSSELGVAKPDEAYFRTVLDLIGRPPRSVLFVDDNPANVASARTVGLHAEQYDLRTGVAVLRDLLRSYGLPLPA
jgi:putative hydrolase of the HAD superfamily